MLTEPMLSWDNHFTIYVNQTIRMSTFNLYSVVCQLFLSKSGEKKEADKKVFNKK